MISNRPTVPLLVHEDCMGDIKTDLAGQQAILSEIAYNTGDAFIKLDDIQRDVLRIMETSTQTATNTSSIKTSSSNTATQLGTIKEDTGSLMSSVGLPADSASSNTVIGLLKSIANKL